MQDGLLGASQDFSIRQYLTEDAAKTLVVSLVPSYLDYGNRLLTGIPECLLHKLKKIRNASASLILTSSQQERTKPLLKALHWLPISDHITNCPACVTTPSLPPPLNTSLTFYKSTRHPVLYGLPQTHINWRALCSKRNIRITYYYYYKYSHRLRVQ